MTTTTATNTETTKKNMPTHEIFTVEGKDEAAVWTKVGIAFPTKKGTSHRVFIGNRGDPKQKVFLVSPNSFVDRDDGRPDSEPKRNVYANVYEMKNGENIDFKNRDGVAFLNRDDSMSLLIGDRGDLQQAKYQMRAVRRFTKRAAG